MEKNMVNDFYCRNIHSKNIYLQHNLSYVYKNPYWNGTETPSIQIYS
jgi:hypothetical protein